VSSDATLRLRDGRILAYSEAGALEGAPVFHFPGSPGSRLERWGGDAPYRMAGARLITTDRPGIGRSDHRPGRTLLDWPGDVAELADALGLGRFAVMGHSLGAAYALACAYARPDLVAVAAIVGAVPRLDEPGGIDALGPARYWRVTARWPTAMRATYAGLIWALRLVPRFGHWLYFRGASEADRTAVDPAEVRRRFRMTALEAARQGSRGLVDDMRVVLEPWGFQPADITAEVMIWHGRRDDHVSPRVAERYATTIRRCECTFLEDESHFSLVEGHAEEIVRPLVERVSAR
jgi:pimeloyl-ACP methyl ester carboxylesterase